MKLEVEVLCSEMIKPCCPTPHHFRQYKLSFLDQVSPLVYNPLVLFYSNDTNQHFNTNTNTLCERLKKSLSEVLTHFYPLAGRLVADNTFIDCNDQGIPFSEARVKCQLLQVIQNPQPAQLNHLLPFQLDNVTDIGFGVQFNVFDCGGVALGACLSHQIADGLSFFNFLNAWAQTSTTDAAAHRVKIQLPLPKPHHFVSAEIFPPRNLSGFDPRSGVTKDNLICNRFVFDASVIEALRAKYADDTSTSRRPSRVEALSAFIWIRYVAAVSQPHTHTQKTYAVVHAVNLRPRMEPPLPPDSFGNYYRFVMTIPSFKSGEECDGVGLVKQVREQINKIDKDYVKKLQEGKEHLNFLKDTSYRVLVKQEMASFSFTSLCRFPLYDADFGWGKPTWVGSPALTFKNLVVFIDTNTGGGIEAYVSLTVEDMAKFQQDAELRACVG